jgi:hypothetical protein
MSTAWMLYWFTRLDNITNFCIGLMIFSTIVAIICGFIYLMISDTSNQGSNDPAAQKVRKIFKISFPTSLIASLLLVFVPTQQDVAVIVGGQLAADVVQSPEAKELGNKVLELVNQQLDEHIKK